MRTLLLWLVIPGAIITYLVIGFFVCLLLCRIAGTEWRDEIDEIYGGMIVVWPLALVAVIWLVLVGLLERIADITRKDRKDE